MEKILNFKRVEVSGANKEEALASAPFGIQGDATQAYRNAREKHVGAWSDACMKQFMLDYLAKKSKNLPGVGFYITLESAIVDSKMRPYTKENVKSEGTREMAKVFQLIDPETNRILAETKAVKEQVTRKDEDGNVVKIFNEDGTPKMHWKTATQSEAEKLGAKLYIDGYTGKIEARLVKKVVSGEPVAFKMEYSPSKNTRNGQYLVFGIENA